jgi:hypothetical protein
MFDDLKTASHWLDKAIQMEIDGDSKGRINLTFKRALVLDEREHYTAYLVDTAVSLPRAA